MLLLTTGNNQINKMSTPYTFETNTDVFGPTNYPAYVYSSITNGQLLLIIVTNDKHSSNMPILLLFRIFNKCAK